jgi:hypothetical protein
MCECHFSALFIVKSYFVKVASDISYPPAANLSYPPGIIAPRPAGKKRTETSDSEKVRKQKQATQIKKGTSRVTDC